ncbi:MAG: hypothetical protein M1823_007030, partial [Watsoniomyces obsoletus]
MPVVSKTAAHLAAHATWTRRAQLKHDQDGRPTNEKSSQDAVASQITIPASRIASTVRFGAQTTEIRSGAGAVGLQELSAHCFIQLIDLHNSLRSGQATAAGAPRDPASDVKH